MDFFCDAIQKAFNDIIGTGLLTLQDIKKRVFKLVVDLSLNETLHILECFLTADMSGVKDKESYLYECFLDHIYPKKPVSELLSVEDGVVDPSNRASIEALLKRTGYTLDILNGKRKYGGPPPDWDKPLLVLDDSNSKNRVQISNLFKTHFEDKIVPLFEKYGYIYQVLIITEIKTGVPKGYAFVDYSTPKEAQALIEACNSGHIKSEFGLEIRAQVSKPTNKLYIRGFTVEKSVEDVKKELKRIFSNSTDIICLNCENIDITAKNSGSANVSFQTHEEAKEARRRLINGKSFVFGQLITNVEWTGKSENISTPNSNPIKNDEFVKNSIDVKFLNGRVSDERIRQFFNSFGKVLQVLTIGDITSVLFANNKATEAALSSHKCVIDKVKINVTRTLKIGRKNLAGKRKMPGGVRGNIQQVVKNDEDQSKKFAGYRRGGSDPDSGSESFEPDYGDRSSPEVDYGDRERSLPLNGPKESLNQISKQRVTHSQSGGQTDFRTKADIDSSRSTFGGLVSSRSGHAQTRPRKPELINSSVDYNNNTKLDVSKFGRRSFPPSLNQFNDFPPRHDFYNHEHDGFMRPRDYQETKVHDWNQMPPPTSTNYPNSYQEPISPYRYPPRMDQPPPQQYRQPEMPPPYYSQPDVSPSVTSNIRPRYPPPPQPRISGYSLDNQYDSKRFSQRQQPQQQQLQLQQQSQTSSGYVYRPPYYPPAQQVQQQRFGRIIR